jgi:S-adenosylmethionine synthetase
MFSLKSELFFPSIEMAKEFARKLNERRKVQSVSSIDPREQRRIRLELEAAREKARVSAIVYRNGLL